MLKLKLFFAAFAWLLVMQAVFPVQGKGKGHEPSMCHLLFSLIYFIKYILPNRIGIYI
jgi:hypothetical protein